MTIRTMFFRPGRAVFVALVSVVLGNQTLAQDDAKSAAELQSAALELFEKKCQECHHEDTEDEFPYLHKAVDLAELMEEDGGVVAGKPEESEVYKRVVLGMNLRKRMPKSKGAPGDDLYRDPLSDDEKQLLHDWISGLGDAKSTPPTPPPSSDSEAAEEGDKPQPKAETVAAASGDEDELPEGLELEEQVHFLLERSCSACHNPQKRRRPFLSDTTDLTALVRSEDAQSIHDRVSLPADDDERMPPSDGKPGDEDYVAPLSAEEQAIIGRWLAQAAENEGIRRETIGFATWLQAIRSDLEENDSSAKYFRYLTLTNLYNAKDEDGYAEIGDDMMDSHRAGISKMINSLSTDGKITVPKAIDDEKTVYRIDLRDYQWTAADWERMVHFYPHGILGIDGRTENLIQDYTGSKMAYLRADWFAFAASQPPLYDEIMDRLLGIDGHDPIEGIQQRVEEALGVDRVHNLQHGHAVRAGFRESGVSDHNRLIERHESDFGYYWVSYDFKRIGAGPHQDLRQAPLGPVEAHLTTDDSRIFDHDGGEMIYTLPNGLQGYLLATADGDRLRRAPNDIVRDSNRTDGTIINGISCIKCHSNGIKPAIDVPLGLAPGATWDDEKMGPSPQTLAGMTDEIGPFVIEAGLIGGRERGSVEDLYAPAEELRRLVLLDYERFKEANEAATAGLASAVTEPVAGLYDAYYLEPIDALRLSSELGVEYDEMLDLLEKESFSSDSIRTLYLALKNGQAEPRDQLLLSWIPLVYLLGYDLMPFEPLAYEEFDGETHAKLVRESATYLTLFGDYQAPVAVSAAEAKVKITKSDAVLEEQASRVVTFDDGKKLTVSVEAKIDVGKQGNLKISSEKDVFIRVMHFSADDKVTQFFPNDVDTDNFLKAKGPTGKQNTKTIPFLTTPNEGDEKGGPEYFVIFASEDQIEVEVEGANDGGYEVYDRDQFYTSRGVAKALISKDTEATKKKALSSITEARVGYLLVE